MKNAPLHPLSSTAVLLGACLANHPAWAAEHLAASLEPADIQSAADAASSGDTVVLPAGDYTGTGYNGHNPSTYSAVTLRAGVSLRGQGIDQTIIRQTAGGDAFFYFNISDESTTDITEVSGFRLIGPGIDYASGFALRLRSLPIIHVHDVRIEEKANTAIEVNDCGKGVIHDCSFYNIINDSNPEPSHGLGGYGVAVSGDDVFDFPYPALGTDEAIFIEDCHFSRVKHSVASSDDSKYVFRHNVSEDGWSYHGHVDAHGNSASTGAGSNTWEVYNNVLRLGSIEDPGEHSYGIMQRGGTGVIWGNQIIGGGSSDADHAILLSDIDESGSCPGDYPSQFQVRNVYAWENTYDGSPVEPYEDSCWLEEDRYTDPYFDYRNMPMPGYQPYPYPHPLQGEAGAGGAAGAGGTGGTSSAGGAAGAGATSGGTGGIPQGGGAPGADADGDGSCGCAVPGTGAPGGASAVVLGLWSLGWAFRRRRRTHRRERARTKASPGTPRP